MAVQAIGAPRSGTVGEMEMPTIEWKIDIGHIITIVALVIAGAIAWGAMSTKLDQYAVTLTEVRTEIKLLEVRVDDVRTQQIITSTELKVRQAEEDGLERKKK
jgi:hypothetical protein